MSKRLTLKDEKVEEFLKFYSTSKYLRDKDEKTLKQYAINHEISEQALCQDYLTIEGFKEEVWRRKVEKFISIAESGLSQRAEGMEIEEVRKNPKEGITYIKKELAPDPSACEILLKYAGALTDEIKHIGEIDANLVISIIKKYKGKKQ